MSIQVLVGAAPEVLFAEPQFLERDSDRGQAVGAADLPERRQVGAIRSPYLPSRLQVRTRWAGAVAIGRSAENSRWQGRHPRCWRNIGRFTGPLKLAQPTLLS